jgi:hypothetical protein
MLQGVWQTVWLEQTPAMFVTNYRISPTLSSITVTVNTNRASTTPVIVSIFFAGQKVTSASIPIGTPSNITIPNPQIWSPNTPNLYNITFQPCTDVSPIICDSATGYFGLRVVSLGSYNKPGSPGTGPQTGIDRPGLDLPGYPVDLPTADPDTCWAMCNTTADCKAWAYGIPDCGGDPSQAQCWLKGGYPGTSAQACRISGAQAVPGGVARRPFINNEFTFLAGWLDQVNILSSSLLSAVFQPMYILYCSLGGRMVSTQPQRMMH